MLLVNSAICEWPTGHGLRRAEGYPGVLDEPRLHRVVGHGPRDEVPLRPVAAQGAKREELTLLLDALGDDDEVEQVAELDGRLHDRAARDVAAEPRDERSVDLERVDGETSQIRER